MSLRGSLARPRASSVSVRPRLARAPRGSAAAGTPKPRNYFHPVRHTLPPTQTGFEQPGNPRLLGRLPVKGAGAPAGPILLVLLPVRHSADPGTARSRPLAAGAPGSCGGGEVVARRRAPPPGGLCARASARTARAEHVAPGPPSAPLTLETWRSLAAPAPPGARQLVSSLSGPLGAPAASPRRPRCARLRLCIWRAKSRGRPPRSPRGFSSPAAGGRRRRPTGALRAPSGKSPWGKSERPRWEGLTLSFKLVPWLGPERTGGSPGGDPCPKPRSSRGVAPGKEPGVTAGAQELRRRQGDSRLSPQGHE